MKKNYIIFDLADTLVELEPSPDIIISNYIKDKYSIYLDKLLIKKTLILLSNIFHYSSVKVRDEISKRDFYLKFNYYLLNILGVSHICSPDEIFKHLTGQKLHWKAKEGLLNIFKNFKEQNLNLSLLSNFNYKEAIEILSKNGIYDVFDYIHISEKEGLEKPNIQFYNSFFLKNKIPKHECIYIGDSYSLDFIPSKKINLSFVLLDELNLFEHIDNRINNLNQIVNTLKKYD